MSKEKKHGSLVIIGGGEDREGKKVILREVARRLTNKSMVLMTVASHDPEGYYEQYKRAFGDFGITDLREVYVNTRSEAALEKNLEAFDGVSGVFFSGGDQLRITSQVCDTALTRRVKQIFDDGGVIAGTSAGASAMCETMLVKGPSRESARIGDLHMAPGLGLIKDAIIDQHFAERGRMGRLLGSVAQNPRILGIGIDEDTAIILDDPDEFLVIGNGAVYVVDGEAVSYSNVAEEQEARALSIFDVKLHVLSDKDSFDLVRRRPRICRTEDEKD